jgi:hypothetical protein
VNCSSWGWAPDGHTYGGCWLKRGTRDSLIKSSVGLSSSAYKGCYSGCSTKGLAGPTGAVDCCAARSVDTGKYWVVRNSWGPDWCERDQIYPPRASIFALKEPHNLARLP